MEERAEALARQERESAALLDELRLQMCELRAETAAALSKMATELREARCAQARLAHLKLVEGDKAGAVKELKRIIDKEAGGDPYQAEARNILAEIAISERRW